MFPLTSPGSPRFLSHRWHCQHPVGHFVSEPVNLSRLPICSPESEPYGLAVSIKPHDVARENPSEAPAIVVFPRTFFRDNRCQGVEAYRDFETSSRIALPKDANSLPEMLNND
jgi:hypothetical protein